MATNGWTSIATIIVGVAICAALAVGVRSCTEYQIAVNAAWNATKQACINHGGTLVEGQYGSPTCVGAAAKAGNGP